MRPVMPPTFLKRWTTLRGMKTMLPGPALAVSSPTVTSYRPSMMNKISSCLKCIWLGGPSPGLCHATMTEVAPPVASVVRSTSMSRPKGLIDNACLGVTTAGCNGVCASMDVVSSSSRPLVRRGLAGRRRHGEFLLQWAMFLLRWVYDKPCAPPRCSTPGTGIGGLLGQIAGAPPACSDNGSQTARLRLVRSKIFRAPSSVRRASEHRAAQGQRVGGEPHCLETGCLAALRGGGGEHADQVVLRLEHQRRERDRA